MMYGVVDTIGMSREQKHALFLESFSFRYAHIRKAAEKGDISGPKYRKIKQTLDGFEQEFLKEGFYYMQVSYVVLAGR